MAGHKIHIAYDGETALQSVGGIRPDIIFLDLMLPSRDGITVCAKLKGNPDIKAIPAVMLTDRTEMRAVNETLRAGVEDYIRKLDDIETIWAQIDEKIA